MNAETGQEQQPARPRYLPRTLALAGIVLFYWLMQTIAARHDLLLRLHIPATVSVRLAGLLEHHLWEFSLGMIAVVLLSRGHLWSYGINSMNIRLSLRYLVRFYVVALFVIAGGVVIPLLLHTPLPPYLGRTTTAESAGWLLFAWLAVPVADETVFHGLVQTVLVKFWPEEVRIGSWSVPVAIFFSTAVFVTGRTSVSIYGNATVEYALAAGIGLFGGWVYYRTRSLLAPMLAQAFLYGMPFAIRLLWMRFA